MTDKIKGFISDVRITTDIARYVVRNRSNTIKERLHILWLAIRHVFTGRGLYLTSTIQANVGKPGLSMTYWIRLTEDTPWEHWGATFDGKCAHGYVNGEEVKGE